MEIFYKQLADILEVAAVQDSDVLSDFSAWDSLAILSTIAMVDTEFNMTLGAESVSKAQTVGDLAALVKKQANG